MVRASFKSDQKDLATGFNPTLKKGKCTSSNYHYKDYVLKVNMVKLIIIFRSSKMRR